MQRGNDKIGLQQREEKAEKERISRFGIEGLLKEYGETGEIISNLKRAEKLASKNVILPNAYQEKDNFISIAEYFEYLVTNNHDLFIALHKNPKIIRQQDENQMTLLHHAASGKIGINLEVILHQLLNAPGVDFNIKDNNGNTPLHVAALNCIFKEIYDIFPIFLKKAYKKGFDYPTFPIFLKRATKNGFDFSSQGEEGQTVLHMATINSYMNCNNVKRVLNIVPHIELDILSHQGKTAFSLAIEKERYDEAISLLAAGANPFAGSSMEKLLMIITKKELLKIVDRSIHELELKYKFDRRDNNIRQGLEKYKNALNKLLPKKPNGEIKIIKYNDIDQSLEKSKNYNTFLANVQKSDPINIPKPPSVNYFKSETFLSDLFNRRIPEKKDPVAHTTLPITPKFHKG